MSVRSRCARPACALLVSLAVAGTGLAVPAAAFADQASSGGGLGLLAASADASNESAGTGSDAASADTAAKPEAPDAAEAPATPEADQGLVTFGGLQLRVPEDYTAMELGGMLLATNDDGSVIVTLIVGDADGMATQDDLRALVAETVEDAEGTVADEGPTVLADGTEAYACTFDVESDGVMVTMHQVYVLLNNDSLALAQFAYEAGASAAAAEEVEEMAATMALAPEVEETFEVFEGAGVSVKVSSRLVLDETTVDTEPTWYSIDDAVVFGLLPDLMDGASQLTDDDYAMLCEQFAADMGGTSGEVTMVAADGVDVAVCVFVFSDGAIDYAGIIGLVPVADDTLTGILTFMDADAMDAYEDAIEEMYESVSLLQ